MKKLLVGSALIGALLPCAVLAAEGEGYGALGIGRADLGSMYTQGPGHLNAFEKAKTGYKLFGGYQFSPNFALEGGHVDFGSHKGSGVDENGFTNPQPDVWKYSAYTISAVGLLPLDGGFSVLGKAGVAISKMGEYDSDGTTAINRNNSLLLGVGLNYDFGKAAFVRAEYEIFGKVGNGSGGPQATGRFKPKMFSLNVGIKF